MMDNLEEKYKYLVEMLGQRTVDVASGVVGTVAVLLFVRFIVWLSQFTA